MPRYYSYVDTTVGIGSTTVEDMLTDGSEFGVVPSIDIVARNITATGAFIGTLGNSNNLFADIVVTGIATIGIVTGATYYGDGQNLSGVVTSITAGTGISITQSGGSVIVESSAGGVGPNDSINTTGIITASEFYGDGSNLTGISSFSGNYNDLTNKPTIPTNNNQLTNGAGYITGVGTFSGNYNDLTNTPSIPSNTSDLTNDSGFITSTEAFSGNYNDLTNTPNIPTDNNQLSNGAGYVTSSGTVALAEGLTGTPNITVGIVTGTHFYGDGSGLTGITATGSGVAIRDNGSIVGTASTIDFGTNLSVDFTAGIATITASGGGGGGASVTVSTTPPSSPSEGDLWYSENTGRTYIYYTDSDSSQWVDASPVASGIVTDITANSLVVTGISTLGIVTGATYYGDGSNLTGISGGGAGGAGTLVIGYGSTNGDTPAIVGTATTINFVGTGYTVSVANSVATVRNLGMGMTSLSITSVGYGETVSEGSQISYTATASDANARFHIESSDAGLGQIGINYESGVMGGGQNASAGTYNVKLRAATLFGLSEPKDISFTIDAFTLSMNTMFGDPTTFVMMTDDNDDATYISLSTGGVVSYDGSNYVIDRSNANYSTATKHALYYDNTNNVLYGFRTNSSNNAISGIYKWTSVTSASHGTSVGSGSAQQTSSWADDYAVSEVSAIHGTRTYNTLTLNAGTDDFDGAYTRQSFKAKLDTGSAGSGNALFAADSGYWWFLKNSDNSRMIIYDSVAGSWTYVYVNGANFSTAADNTAVGSPNATESQSITGVVYDDNALQPEAEYSEITYSGSLGTAGYQPGGNYTHGYGGAFAMKITTTGGIMNNFGTGDTDWAYGFTLEDPWLVTSLSNQLLAPESTSDGWHNVGISIFNIGSTEYDYIVYGNGSYGPFSTGSIAGGYSRQSNTNNIANAGDTVQVRFDGTGNGYYYVYINGVLKVTTSSPDTYMQSTNTTNPVLCFGDTSNQNGGTITNDYAVGAPWPFRIRDLWIANNGNISASDVGTAATFTSRNLADWDQYSDVDVYITMDSSGVTSVKGSPTVERKSITFS